VEGRVALSQLAAGQDVSVTLTDLDFLSEQEQLIVHKRLMKIQWKQIQEEFESRWKPISIQGLVMKLGRMRRKHRIIQHILPARPRRASKAMDKLVSRQVRKLKKTSVFADRNVAYPAHTLS
jgi:flagellar biosynthesis chaperone FliJ